MTQYKVVHFLDGTYEVCDTRSGDSLFQGSLSDCEAWIRLQEGGYL